MAFITRRQFLQQAALAAAMACGQPRALAQRAGPLDAESVRKLASRLAGRVITAHPSDYESARLVFNLAFDLRPALIVRCAAVSDIARALDFAQTQRLPLAVRGGGHSRAGFSACDGSLVIDLSAMNRVDVDERKRIARAGAGALVRDLDRATQRFGLATTSGGCPTVGLAGLTLGGGEGLLMSKYGAACDNLVSAQLVTVDGREVIASHNSNPDLFWAIRGGGGNFGVVTTLEYRLHPVTDVLAGTLTYPIGSVSERLQAFAKFVAAAPDEMNVVGQVLPSKEGSRFHVLVCHCGDPRTGNTLLAPLRALKPQKDDIRVASYLETQTTINPYEPAAHFQTNLVLSALSEMAIERIAEATSDAPPNTKVFIVPIYGAIARVGLSETAFPLRRPCYELDLMGRWNAPADQARAVEWVKALRDRLKPLAVGVYANQLGETSEELVSAAYGSHYARLASIKRKYDPANVLHLNQNIKPAF